MSSSSSASSLSPKIVSDALAAVASKDAKGSLAVLQQILAALLGGSADEAPPSSAAGGPPDSSATPGAKDTAGLSALLAAFKGAPAVNAELGATAQIKAVAAAFGVAVDDYAGMTAALEKAIKAAKTAPQALHLSADQLKICKEAGVDPAVFLAAKTRKIVLEPPWRTGQTFRSGSA